MGQCQRNDRHHRQSVSVHRGYLDEASGLYQMGARYYQPATGRFTQPDPLPASVLTINRYADAGGNPVNFVDPVDLLLGVGEYGPSTPFLAASAAVRVGGWDRVGHRLGWGRISSGRCHNCNLRDEKGR